MIAAIQPATLATLQPSDRFHFDGDPDTYYFIGNFGISGFVSWNETQHQRRIDTSLNYAAFGQLTVTPF